MKYLCNECYNTYRIEYHTLDEHVFDVSEQAQIAEELGRCSSCSKLCGNVGVRCKNLQIHLGYIRGEHKVYVEERWADIFPELNGNGWKAFLQIRRKYRPGPNFLQPQEPDWAKRPVWAEKVTTVLLGYKKTTFFISVAVFGIVKLLSYRTDPELSLLTLEALIVSLLFLIVAFLTAERETDEIKEKLAIIKEKRQKNLPEDTLLQLPDDDEPEIPYSEDDIVPDHKIE